MADPSEIADAILARCVSLTLSPALPKAYPDVTFKPPSSGKYVEFRDFPNRPAWGSLAGGSLDQGLLQATVHWPRGTGIIAPLAVAKAVIDHFPKALRLYSGETTVKISGDPWAAAPLFDDKETLIPITIPWTASTV